MISIMKFLKNWCLMNGNEIRLINLFSVKGVDLGEILEFCDGGLLLWCFGVLLMVYFFFFYLRYYW